MLQTIIAWLAAAFSSLFTNVSGAFNALLNELPDQLIAVLHAGMVAASDSLNAGDNPGTALQKGVEAAEVEFGQELTADLEGLLQFFVARTAPAQPATAAK